VIRKGKVMATEIYRYAFSSDVPPEEIEASLLLAVLATESLHGEAQVRLDAAHYFDPARRTCVIDSGTAVGRDFNRVFVGFVTREFGADSFRVERLTKFHHAPQEIAA
jgi:hypothetical protein